MKHASLRALTRVLVTTIVASAAAQTDTEVVPSPQAPPPISLRGPEDSGTFTLYANEEPVITCEFTWSAEGAYEGRSKLSIAGQHAEFSLRIEPDESGLWKRIEYRSPVADIDATRQGGKCTLEMKNKAQGKEESRTEELKPGHVLFENSNPALMSLAVRAYDMAKGGEQEIPTLAIPGGPIDAKVRFVEKLERTIDGKVCTFSRSVYDFMGLEIFPWTDEQGRLYLAEVPSQHSTYVRDGYEVLLQKPIDDPLLSRAVYEVVEERGVHVPMRDGVGLSTDLFRPKDQGKYPLVHIRTPYKKEMQEMVARYWARRGYAVAVQDVRGRFASEGEWEPFVNEARDGYDSIEWLAKQEWCDGKVGMIGASYLGWVQWLAASQNPPHLVCLIPNVAPPDPFYNIPYEYGAFFLQGAIWWAEVVESEATADITGGTLLKIFDREYDQILRSLPVIDLDKKIFGKENRYWRNWILHPTRDSYWESACHLDKLGKAAIPAFHQSGWFDGDGVGSKLNHLAMAAHGHPHQKLVLGPWGHTDTATRKLGDFDFGPKAIIDLQSAYLRWFDHFLKGVDNGIEREPLVSLFVMGTNDWLHGNTYPLEGTRFDPWYLGSGGKANTSGGDGSLSREEPGADSPPDHYVYDPADPTPAPIAFVDDETTKDLKGEERDKAVEAYHGKVLERRQDILVYTSEPFAEPYTFAGPVSARLWATTSGKDTDWFVSLDEVTAEGEIYSLARGRLRARYRNGVKTTELVEPDQIVEYHIDIWQTGVLMPAGSRLRVEIASAYFPLFSRNLNTGGHNETETEFVSATQTILHDAAHPSHVLLPAIPPPATEKSGD